MAGSVKKIYGKMFAWSVTLLLILWGCGERQEGAKPPKMNRPPVVTEVKISPGVPSSDDTLRAVVAATDPEGDPIQYSYRWEVNSQVLPLETGPELPASRFSRGSTVVVRVSASDGKATGKEVSSRPVVVKNRVPTVKRIQITPYPAFPGDELEAEVEAEDPDGDRVEVRYSWMVNGELVEGESSARFSTERLRRGDRVLAQVVAEDSEQSGTPVSSQEVVLENRPPRFVSQPPENLVAPGHYRYEVKAEDPDGDRLEFRLEGPVPEGMRIDPVTGILEWDFETPPEGSVSVDIRVSDGQGGEARQSYDFRVGASAAS
ncbi:MAG: putative Ig domain-containing protein [Thermodesulfobacteriota bacterium]